MTFNDLGLTFVRSTTAFCALALLVVLCRTYGAAPTGSAKTRAATTETNWSRPSAVSQVIVVFKTHFDIGYTDMASNIVQKYRTKMIDQALEVVDQNRDLPPTQQFKWTLSGWPMHKITEDWSGQTAERRKRVEDALKEGRFVVHALPFSTHTELLELEDLVRGLGYSSRLARDLGLELPRDGKMTDVPEHTWALATLLKHAGVTFMHIGCNGASGAPRVPPLYWWEGPDGSRVLTMYSPNYGTGLLPPEDWPYRTWLALQHTGDNHGPPRPSEVKRVLEELNQKMPGVKVRIGRLSDFGDAILAEHPKLTVVHADTPDTWIHGPMSDPAGARLARNVRPLIAAAEGLNTELHAWGLPVADATPAVAQAYEQSLLYGEHTWGGSIGWLGRKFGFGEQFVRERAEGRFTRIESSWDEHSAYIKNAVATIDPVLKENLQILAGAVNATGQRVVVYNPLPWKRSGLVTAKWNGPAVDAFKAADGNETVLVESTGAEFRFLATDLPPMGYRVYVPVKVEAGPPRTSYNQQSSTIENKFYTAVLDPGNGTVRSLIEKRTGRELVDSKAAQGFGQYLYERFSSNQMYGYVHSYLKQLKWTVDFEKPGLPADAPYHAASPSGFSLRFEQTPIAVSAIMQAKAGGGVPDGVTTRVTLYQDQPYVDLELTVHDKPLEPWPEAGWICLPFKVPDPEFRLGRLGSIIDPARDIVPGANHDLFGINSGVAVMTRRGPGVAFCPLDNPLVSLERPGCWKFSPEFVPTKPVAFVNLFNNQWNTNFRLWNSGTWTSRVRIWGFGKFDPAPALITPAVEARYPLLAAATNALPGNLPAARAGISLSKGGVLVTAFGKNPDGPGTILRLWELAGQSGACRVQLPDAFRTGVAVPVDLRGQPTGKPITLTSGLLKTAVRPFAPSSYVLRQP